MRWAVRSPGARESVDERRAERRLAGCSRLTEQATRVEAASAHACTRARPAFGQNRWHGRLGGQRMWPNKAPRRQSGRARRDRTGCRLGGTGWHADRGRGRRTSWGGAWQGAQGRRRMRRRWCGVVKGKERERDRAVAVTLVCSQNGLDPPRALVPGSTPPPARLRVTSARAPASAAAKSVPVNATSSPSPPARESPHRVLGYSLRALLSSCTTVKSGCRSSTGIEAATSVSPPSTFPLQLRPPPSAPACLHPHPLRCPRSPAHLPLDRDEMSWIFSRDPHLRAALPPAVQSSSSYCPPKPPTTFPDPAHRTRAVTGDVADRAEWGRKN